MRRREEEYVDRRTMNKEVDGTRGRERPRRRTMDSVRDDLRENKGLARWETRKPGGNSSKTSTPNKGGKR